MIRKSVAGLLRRLAQRLSPLLTDAQVRDLRDYYDNHDSITGEPIIRNTLNVYSSGPIGDAVLHSVPVQGIW